MNKEAKDFRSRWDIWTFSRLSGTLNFFPEGQRGAYTNMQNFTKITEKEEKQ